MKKECSREAGALGYCEPGDNTWQEMDRLDILTRRPALVLLGERDTAHCCGVEQGQSTQ